RSTACQRCNTAHQRGVPRPCGSRTRLNLWQSTELPLRGSCGLDYRGAVELRKDCSFDGFLGDLTCLVTDHTIGCELHECHPRRAIVGLGFPATHCWRTAQGRICQSKKDHGPIVIQAAPTSTAAITRRRRRQLANCRHRCSKNWETVYVPMNTIPFRSTI